MIATTAYQEIIDFIASGTSPETVIQFRPSNTTQKRVSELLHKEKNGALTPEEQSEMENYMLIEHLMRLAKARARQLMKNE